MAKYADNDVKMRKAEHEAAAAPVVAPQIAKQSDEEIQAAEKAHTLKLKLMGEEDKANRAELEAAYHDQLRDLDALAAKGEDVAERKKTAELEYRSGLKDLDDKLHEEKLKQIEKESKARLKAIQAERDAQFELWQSYLGYMGGDSNHDTAMAANKASKQLQYSQDMADAGSDPNKQKKAYGTYMSGMLGLQRDEKQFRDRNAEEERDAHEQSVVDLIGMTGNAHAKQLAEIDARYDKEKRHLAELAKTGEDTTERLTDLRIKRTSDVRAADKQADDEKLRAQEQQEQKRKSMIGWASAGIEQWKAGMVVGQNVQFSNPMKSASDNAAKGRNYTESEIRTMLSTGQQTVKALQSLVDDFRKLACKDYATGRG
jgi:hypothetical protein